MDLNFKKKYKKTKKRDEYFAQKTDVFMGGYLYKKT